MNIHFWIKPVAPNYNILMINDGPDSTAAQPLWDGKYNRPVVFNNIEMRNVRYDVDRIKRLGPAKHVSHPRKSRAFHPNAYSS